MWKMVEQLQVLLWHLRLVQQQRVPPSISKLAKLNAGTKLGIEYKSSLFKLIFQNWIQMFSVHQMVVTYILLGKLGLSKVLHGMVAHKLVEIIILIA